MTGYDYEYTVAAYLRHKGYSRVKVTQGSGDYGIDVLASKGNIKYAVQCKYYSNPVGVKAVQEAVAGVAYYGCNRAMVVTNNTFTPQAKKLAAANNVVLLENVTKVDATSDRAAKLTVGTVIEVALLLFYIVVVAACIESTIGQTGRPAVQNWIAISVMVIVPILMVVAKIQFKKKHQIFGRLTFRKFLFWLCRDIKTLCKRIGKVKRIYFVITDKEDRVYKQSNKDNPNLDVSSITGLPHKFIIEGRLYDLDNAEDIKVMPLVFTSFLVNGTEYYFNNYFRLCAKLYRRQGYRENAKALKIKAAEMENDSFSGWRMRKQAKTIIKAPGLK